MSPWAYHCKQRNDFFFSGSLLSSCCNISNGLSRGRDWRSTLPTAEFSSSRNIVHPLRSCIVDNSNFGIVRGKSLPSTFLADDHFCTSDWFGRILCPLFHCLLPCIGKKQGSGLIGGIKQRKVLLFTVSWNLFRDMGWKDRDVRFIVNTYK